MFVEARHRGGELNRGEVVLSNKIVQRFSEGAGFFDGSLFGFISDDNLGKIGERRELLTTAHFDEVVVKAEVVGSGGEVDNGRSGLISLNKNRRSVKMAATDATDNLGEKFEGFFFGGEIGKGESGISLDDADGSEVGKVETTGDGLGTDEDFNIAVFNVVIESVERIAFFVIGVEASDASF